MKKNMIIKIFRTGLFLSLFFLSSAVFAQQKITIKLASVVPEDTPFGVALNQLAAEWKKITNGEVDVIVYHNKTAGKEPDVLRNLRSNQLQAGVLSTFGLKEIVPEIIGISCPFLIRNNEELELVMSEFKSEIEAKINSRGLHVIAWANIGWVKFFSKAPVFLPSDLKKMKLGTSSDLEEINSAFRSMGFQMVSVNTDDMLIALSSPLVDAVYQSPIVVGGMQIFGVAKNMTSIGVAPFLGSVLINQRTWNRIPEKYKPQMVEVLKRMERNLDQNIKVFEEDLIKMMGTHGLKVNQLTPAQEQVWYDEFTRAMPGMIGTVIDKAMHSRIEAILKEHRNKRGQ